MNNPRPYSNPQFVCNIRELVRGREHEILEQLQPLVHSQSVRLDLSSVERVDAAGLFVLVTLYCDACKAGFEFTVVNPPRHVARILAIVGLDCILLSNDSRETLPPRIEMEMIAA
jgi:anti-anti-sigma factor